MPDHLPAPVLQAFPLDVPVGGHVQPPPPSTGAVRPAGRCIQAINLPLPSAARELETDPEVREAIRRITGLVSAAHAPAHVPLSEVAREVFVQGEGPRYGIHVETRNKGPSRYSGINPLCQLPSIRTPERDWFFPWRAAYPFETQLSLRWDVEVRRAEARTPESHVYGHPTLEFIDVKSGRHLYFTVLTYGTLDPDGDYLAPDVASGIVIVGTTPRAGSPYGRSRGTGWVRMPRDYSAGSGPGERSQVDFRMDLREFRRVLEAARSVDASLSADPADLLLDNYHFNNEVVNEGEIGLNLQVDLRLLRR